MAKSIPRTGSCRNARSGSHKNTCKISKGVIYVQASFNNTIVTVTYVRGRVRERARCFFFILSVRVKTPWMGRGTSLEEKRSR
ncbi:hypothetical protein EUGRSUZ_E03029 [Eucalyptus grandis]|uniref:Uncharacterized protein n=2 Tax=Eucalyptus grandis TaxID=71139 RepID=A0ACC3L053_EUCGR|nr:hypothetical protein EUGRSUZ_E03029 [Eucalyptus grandis]